MPNQILKNTNLLFRLTSLWAFSESGLGGLMHAFKIPFTGFFVGGFAIMILIMFAYYSNHNARLILQATLMVLSIKFAVSPHSPLPAYFAVGFQGLLAALIMGLLKGRLIGAMLFGCIALMESAVQKFLITTLLFGKSVWEALDIFVAGLLKDLHLNPDFSFSAWLIITYCIIYALWGLIIGWWAWRLPKKLGMLAPEIINLYQNTKSINTNINKGKEKKRLSTTTTNLMILLFIVLVFWFTPLYNNKAIYAIFRTIAAITLIYLIGIPLSKWLLSLLLKDQHKRPQFNEIILQLPLIKLRTKTAWSMAADKPAKTNRIFYFITVLLIITLYEDNLIVESAS